MRATIQRAETSLGNTYSPSFWRDVEDGFLYVDVGACKGATTLATAKMYPNIDMIAIEPIKEHADKLRDRTAEIGNRLNIVNMGCWSRRSTVPFYRNPEHLAGSTMMPMNKTVKHDDEVRVSVDTLDSIVSSLGYDHVDLLKLDVELGYDHVDLLKLDVEGAEHMVLKGFQTTLSGTQFHIEYHYNLAYVLDELLNHEIHGPLRVARGGQHLWKISLASSSPVREDQT
jgi:FkbM family methyltransferase